MEHIHTTDHGWLFHKWQCINDPWDTTYLGVHLDENLGDDGAKVLASGDGTSQNNLRRNREFGQEELLDIVVARTAALGSWQKQNNHLAALIELILKFADPCIGTHARLDRTNLWRSALVATSLQALLHGARERGSNLSVTITVEDSPIIKRILLVHLSLNFAINVTSTLFNVERIGSTTS